MKVYVSAGALFGSTLITSVLGFAFWAVAARLVPATEVGIASATISAMQMSATVGTFGLATLLISEIRAVGDSPHRLVVTCLWLAGILSGVIGVLYIMLGRSWLGHDGWLYVSPYGWLLFGCGTALAAATMVVDGGLVGLLHNRAQFVRNSIFALSKLLVLPVFTLLLGGTEVMIFLSWLLGNLISMAWLWRRTDAPRQWIRTLPSVVSARGFGFKTLGHHWVNVATQAPRLVFPVMVAASLGYEANAAFYTALLLVGFVWIIPGHLATAMFAVSSHEPHTVRKELSRTIGFSAALSIIAMIGAPFLAEPVLRVFGPTYIVASGALVVLASATFASALKSMYITICRVRGLLGVAGRNASIGATLELGGAAIGLRSGTLLGVSVWVAVAMVLEAAWCAPTIWKAAKGRYPEV